MFAGRLVTERTASTMLNQQLVIVNPPCVHLSFLFVRVTLDTNDWVESASQQLQDELLQKSVNDDLVNMGEDLLANHEDSAVPTYRVPAGTYESKKYGSLECFLEGDDFICNSQTESLAGFSHSLMVAHSITQLQSTHLTL